LVFGSHHLMARAECLRAWLGQVLPHGKRPILLGEVAARDVAMLEVPYRTMTALMGHMS